MTARCDVIPEFINADEQALFVDWFDNSLAKGINLVDGYSRDKAAQGSSVAYRKTTRPNKDAQFPPIAFEIFKRIRAYYSYDEYPSTDGMIGVATLPGGDTYLHKDPGRDMTFNIIVQNAEQGGDFYLDGDKIALTERSLHAYAPWYYFHKVSEVIGNTIRYLFIFRIKVPVNEWGIVPWKAQ